MIIRGWPALVIALLTLALSAVQTAAQMTYSPYAFTTLAGLAGNIGSADGTNQGARFYSPNGLAVDNATNLYVADTYNHAIRKVSVLGVVTTLAGLAGSTGTADGTNSAARFRQPQGIAAGTDGSVYVADTSNHTIRKVLPVGTNWVVTTIAGMALIPGTADGTNSAAGFRYPAGLAVDNTGIVYVADTWNHTIRKITPAGTNWSVTTLAGQAGQSGAMDGTDSVARFRFPNAVALGPDGNLYVADTSNQTIRKVTPAGIVTTLAGLATTVGSADGTNSAARFSSPSGVAVDASGALFIADTSNCTVRKATPVGTNWAVTLVAGQVGYKGAADGLGSAAQFQSEYGVAVDTVGNLYVADAGNHTIRQGTPGPPGFPIITLQPQSQTVLAGSNVTLSASAGGDEPLAYQWQHGGVAVPGSTNTNYVITNVQPNTAGAYSVTATNASGSVTSATAILSVPIYEPYTFATLAGRAGSSGSADGTNGTALFYDPANLALDDAGNVYVADFQNNAIRKVTPEGVVTTLAGAGGAGPNGVAADKAGNLYVAYRFSGTVCKHTPSGTNWLKITLAGLAGTSGSADGTNSDARFGALGGVALDTATNLYVADTGNHTVRRVTPAGVVSTLAGLAGSPGSADGTNSDARFKFPDRLAVDSAGNIYVADFGNNTIRKATPVGTNWVVTTLAGAIGSPGATDGEGSLAQFSSPEGVAVDNAGNVYVADSLNNTIRKVTANGAVTTLGGWPRSSGGIDGTGALARFSNPLGMAVDAAGNLYVADSGNDTIRKGWPSVGGMAPVITVQPQAQGMPAGGSITLSVSAIGSGFLNYQWWFGALPLAGRTNMALSLGPMARTNTGFYVVAVSNRLGGVVSSNALVRVLVPPRLQLPRPALGGLVRLLFQDADGGLPFDLGAVEIQWRTNLPTGADSNWQSVTSGFYVTNAVIAFDDTNVLSQASRFYRVIEH